MIIEYHYHIIQKKSNATPLNCMKKLIYKSAIRKYDPYYNTGIPLFSFF